MFICVTGPAGSGKSTLAKRLEELQPDVFARVPVDYFFVPRPPAVTLGAYLAEPLRYDWALLDAALQATGPHRSTPDCDFSDFSRRSESGGLPIATAPIAVLDGMRPHPRTELVIMLELDSHEQRRRLMERDHRWGTHLADRGNHLTATFEQGVRDLVRDPDLRLNAADPIEQNADRVIALLNSYSPGRVR